MLITELKGVTRVCEIVHDTRTPNTTKHTAYDKKLKPIWDKAVKDTRSRHVSLVYFFCVNGVINKIGQSSGKGGVTSMLSFYTGAGFGDDGSPRFMINALCREALAAGHKVEVYYIYQDKVEVSVPGLFGVTLMEVPISAKGMEENCLAQYKEIEGEYPVWNFQERGEQQPQHLVERYNAYRVARRGA